MCCFKLEVNLVGEISFKFGKTVEEEKCDVAESSRSVTGPVVISSHIFICTIVRLSLLNPVVILWDAKRFQTDIFNVSY